LLLSINKTKILAAKSTVNPKSGKEDFTKIISLDGNSHILVDYPDFIEDGRKKMRVKGLGEKFAAINSFLLDYLKEYHIPVAFIKNQSKASLKFLNYSKFDFYIKIYNAVDKRTAKIFNKKEFEILTLPLFEFHYGNGKDSLVSESHLISFELCTYEELKLINRICSKVNAVLKSYFERRGEVLAELDCCFGKADDKIYVVEGFSPGSLKIIPQEMNNKSINPYKITTPTQLRKYTEHLFTLTSS
jgi:phosphoribosylaminoimidazole-succinocarboxamide synthase